MKTADTLIDLISLRKKVLNEDPITQEEATRLLDLPAVQIPYLAAIANEVREKFVGNKVEMCALLNAKSGACSEDCQFCSQSGHYKTESPVYGLVDIEEMVKQAKAAEAAGASEFCIVTSGWGQTNPHEFDNIVEAVRRIKQETHIMIDASLGFLTQEQMVRLKTAGLYRNNHNLEAAKTYFDKVCSTHTYDQRANHIEMVKHAGLLPCSGGIIGMGETREERVDLALALRDLEANCVPINILNPRPGTPLGHLAPLEPMEVIRTIAIFRLILPKSTIKVAGGREVNLRDLQSMAFMAGANGLILGNYLTTIGRSTEADLQMLKDLGYEVTLTRQRNSCCHASS